MIWRSKLRETFSSPSCFWLECPYHSKEEQTRTLHKSSLKNPVFQNEHFLWSKNIKLSLFIKNDGLEDNQKLLLCSFQLVQIVIIFTNEVNEVNELLKIKCGMF